MMTFSHRFRRTHTQQLLKRFDLSKGPLDLFVSLYFRHTPQLGSKDRAYVSDKVYEYFRMKGLIDALFKRSSVKDDEEQYWDFAIDLLDDPSRTALKNAGEDQSIPIHDRLSVSEPLYSALLRTWGEKTADLCRSFQRQAPLTIRANSLKIDRDSLIQRLKERGFSVIADPRIKSAIHFDQRVSLFSLPEFQEGFFEIQDMGSQYIAELVNALPKQHILDYCAGAGGKSLAIAPRLQGTGQIYLHDIREDALGEAKKRLKRAGIQNVQLVSHTERSKLSRMQGKMDWVFVDAPCSGTGTMRRNPDMKWKFSEQVLESLIQEQRAILAKACAFLKPSGQIIWATCSLLKEENEDMLEYAMKELGLQLSTMDGDNLIKTSPLDGNWDGFFAVRLQKR